MLSTRQPFWKMKTFSVRLIGLVIMAAGFISNGMIGEAKTTRQNSLPLIIESNSFAGVQNSASTFQNSCTNIRIDGDRLTADCERRNGRYRTSTIAVRGIRNDDGRLEYQRNSRAESTFQNSCRNIRVQGNRLSARCERRDGSFVRASIAIRGIQNDDGRLEYYRD